MTHPDPIIADPAPLPPELAYRPANGSRKRRQSNLRNQKNSAGGPGVRLALLSGLLLWLANPPGKLWPLAWIALVPLVFSVTNARRPRQAFWRGYLFGGLYLGAVWYWTGLTIVAWTHSPIGWFAWLGLTMILACFYGLWGLAAWGLAHGGANETSAPEPTTRRQASRGAIQTGSPLLLAAAWVVMEWARAWGSLTMPWAQVSYTQAPFHPILQFADITGAYGVSFLVVLVNVGVVDAWRKRQRQTANPGRWLAVGLAAAGFLTLYGMAKILTLGPGAPLTVAAMQGNFRMTDAPSIDSALDTFDRLTAQAAQTAPAPPALYVWSESAAPADALRNEQTRTGLEALARRYQAALVIGTRLSDRRHRREANASVLFPADGGKPLHYDKRQLVPFGEFIPFRHSLPDFLDATFQFPDNDVTPGETATLFPFVAQGQNVTLGPFICYEAMYPQYARQMTASGADLLVTQSNDAWFQSRAAMDQHLQAVILRAVENRRDIVRATTTGITCFVDAAGRVTRKAPPDTQAALVGTVARRTGVTVYTRFGDVFVLLCALALFGAAARAALQSRRARQNAPTVPGAPNEA